MIYSWPPTRAHVAPATRRATRRSTSSRSRRSPARSATRRARRQSRARHRLQQGALGGFGQSRGRLPVHAVGLLAAGVAGALHAALCAARSVPDLAFQVGPLWPALSRARKDYLANLNDSANVGLLDPIMPGAQDYFSEPRPHGDVGVGRNRPDGGARRPPRRNGTRPPSVSASTRRRRSTPSS